jgi:hypothetical protein
MRNNQLLKPLLDAIKARAGLVSKFPCQSAANPVCGAKTAQNSAVGQYGYIATKYLIYITNL